MVIRNKNSKLGNVTTTVRNETHKLNLYWICYFKDLFGIYFTDSKIFRNRSGSVTDTKIRLSPHP